MVVNYLPRPVLTSDNYSLRYGTDTTINTVYSAPKTKAMSKMSGLSTVQSLKILIEVYQLHLKASTTKE